MKVQVMINVNLLSMDIKGAEPSVCILEGQVIILKFIIFGCNPESVCNREVVVLIVSFTHLLSLSWLSSYVNRRRGISTQFLLVVSVEVMEVI